MKNKILLFLLLAFFVCFSVPVRGQSSVSRIVIRNIVSDPGQFPQVTVNALILDTEEMPVLGISKDAISLTENGKPVNFEVTEIPSGTRTMIVLDAGKWMRNTGLQSRDSVSTRMKNFALRYVDSMVEDDLTGLIVIYGEKPLVLQQFTNDKARLRDAIKAIDWENREESYGLEGIIKATPELANAPKDLLKQVLFISPGIMMIDPFGKDGSQIAQDLLTHSVAMYAVNTSWQTAQDYSYQSRFIAEKTNGLDFDYIRDEDLNGFFSLLDKKRHIYQITFTSESDESSREVTLSYSGGGKISDTKRYDVDADLLKSAYVEIVVNNGQPLYLQSESESTPVLVEVVFDGLGNRKIENISMFIDGQAYGGSFSSAGDGNKFSTTVPIPRNAVSNGHMLKFEVSAVDQLGKSHEGSTTTTISVLRPLNILCRIISYLPGIGSSASASCVDSGFTLGGLFSVILAVALVVVLVAKRGKVVEVSKDAIEKGKEVIKRVTQRLMSHTDPKAKLTAIKGLPEDSRKEVNLYGETRIGGSNKDADLVFDNPNISSLHCQIHEGHSGRWTIEDLRSTNGTFLNGQKLTPFVEKEIVNTDIIELCQTEYGGIKFRFDIIKSDASEENLYNPSTSAESRIASVEDTRTTRRAKSIPNSQDGEILDPSDPSNQKW